MKPLITSVFAIFISSLSIAQNLVPNHSFEQYINCPSFPSQVTTHCTNWVQYTTGTSDYFNMCATHPWVDVPTNAQGSQNALHGNAYIGLYDFLPIAPQWEYAGVAITAMQIGKVYEVSMSVSLGDSCIYASNGLGAFFFDNGPATYSGTSVLPYTPQISYKDYGPISDKTNWIRLNDYMFADSAYDNIVIGGFLAHNLLEIDTLSSGSYGASYYYIDSVVVRKVNNLNVSLNDSLLCAGDTVILGYSVFIKCYPGNTFTAQLSSSTGSFGNPINIGSVSSDSSGNISCVIPANTANGTGYRIRLVSSQFPDTSADNGFNIKIANRDSVTVIVTQDVSICAGSTVSMSATSTITASYSWSGPAGFNSTLQSPFINNAVPGNSGNYYSTISFYGCQVKDTTTVLVKPMPLKPVAGSNSPLCAGSTLLFSVSDTTAGAAYNWTGPGSFTSSVKAPQIINTTPALSGDYIVTANLNGCTKADTATAVVNPMPDTVAISATSPICAGDTLKLSSDSSSAGATYLWNGPGSFSSAAQNAIISNATVAATGRYKMTVSLNSCSFSDSLYVVVNGIPQAPVLGYNAPLCTSETLQLTATGQAGANYAWTGPGNFISAQQNPLRSNVQFADTGTYKAKTILNGCSSTESVLKVNINPVPFVVILANPADSICQGDPVQFTAYANNHGGIPGYQWYVNAQAVGTGPSFSTTSLNDQDVVRCDMVENTKCSGPYKDESNDVVLKVLPWLAPSVSISASPSRPLNKDEYVTFTATPVNAGINPLYQWKRNGQDIVGATSGTWAANTLNDNDSISVELISSYKCPRPTTALSNGIVVKVLSSVVDKHVLNDIQLYPNPNNGSFIIKGNAQSTRVAGVQVVDAIGRVVYKDELSTNAGKLYHTIELGNTASGVYILKVSTEAGTVVMRFVKQ